MMRKGDAKLLLLQARGLALICASTALLLTGCALRTHSPHAATTPIVVCYGDSITEGTNVFDPSESYPSQLQALRPDLTVVNEGKGADVTGNVARFETALTRDRPDIVVLLMSVNDPFDTPPATPAQSLANLLRMARDARRMGASVFVLTPTPVVYVFSAFCAEHPTKGSCPNGQELEAVQALRQAHTRAVARGLLQWSRQPRITVADLREDFAGSNWPALTKDGLHPTRIGNARIAAFVASLIRAAP